MPTALVLEDEKDIRTLFTEALRVAGFEVIDAATVPDAIELVSRHVPDIAFVDMNLPGHTGAEFLRHLQATPALKRVKTVVVTANRQTQAKAEEMGADLFLLKPVGIAEMLTLAKRLVGID
jgi:CheY-like chemotaxis protein